MASTVLGIRHASKSTGEKSEKSFRADIQGLRAVAVGLVVLYHAGVPWLPGGFVGVDVFFVISGFLITGGIVREMTGGKRLSLSGFYARRIARILPAATIALLGTLVLAWLVLPQTQWVKVGTDVAASSLYVVNWIFAGDAVDYLARASAPSPVQHFWSLAVEEQFYIFWPALLAVVAFTARRFHRNMINSFLIATAIVLVPTLLWSVYVTETNPGAAYFVTTTRLWELAIGAGLAIAAERGILAHLVVGRVVGWLGLAAIAVAGLTFSSATHFPGFSALLPTLGAAAVIWGGLHFGSSGPEAILGVRPMLFVGGISYSLYLWHWPLLIIAEAAFGDLDLWAGLAVVGASLIPAWLSQRFIEDPAQSYIKLKTHTEAIGLGILMTLAGMACAVLLVVATPTVSPPSAVKFTPTPVAGAAVQAAALGAEVLLVDKTEGVPKDSFATITPAPVAAKQDLPNACLQPNDSIDVVPCSFGDEKSATVIALVGDSHAEMLAPGFAQMVTDKKWRVDVYTKAQCPFTTTSILLDARPFDKCLEWVENVSRELLSNKPTLLVTAMSKYTASEVGRAGDPAASDALIAFGLQNAWQPFIDAGVPVVSVRDAPSPRILVPDCVAKNEKTLTNCAVAKADALPENPPEVAATTDFPGVELMDLTAGICPEASCPAVIGGVLVYRDGNHLTATYAASLHGQIETQITHTLQR